MYYNIGSHIRNRYPLLMVIIFVTAMMVAAMSMPLTFAAPTVVTNKLSYSPGDVVSVTGTAPANTMVSIQLFDPNGVRVAVAQAKADLNRTYSNDVVYTFKKTDIEGTWTLKAYQGGISAEVTLTLEGAAPPVVDNISPKLSLSVNPAKNVYKDERINIEVLGNEELSSVAIEVTQKDGVSETVTSSPAIGDTSKWSGTYKISSGYDGKATIKTLAKDLAGNTASTSITFTVDTTAPTVTITAPSRTENPTITISGTLDDPTISSVFIEVSPATPVPVAVVNGKWTAEVILTATGTNTIIASATDAAGNIGKSSAAIIYVGTLEVLVDRVGKLESDIATLQSSVSGELSSVENSLSSDLSSTTTTLKSDMSELKSSIEVNMSTLSTLIIIAVALSLVAAIFAIFSVVTITRKIVLK